MTALSPRLHRQCGRRPGGVRSSWSERRGGVCIFSGLGPCRGSTCVGTASELPARYRVLPSMCNSNPSMLHIHARTHMTPRDIRAQNMIWNRAVCAGCCQIDEDSDILGVATTRPKRNKLWNHVVTTYIRYVVAPQYSRSQYTELRIKVQRSSTDNFSTLKFTSSRGWLPPGLDFSCERGT